MLVINHLTKKFGTKKVLDNVSLTIQEGGIAILLGQSGVGKSTLIRALNNLEAIDSGTITIDGKDFNPETIHKKHLSGMVFQQFNLFEHMTAQENIMLALEKVLGKSHQEAQKIAHDLLNQYGLLDKKNNYPSQLSGGQKQRLALARTIALKPRIICFDEPTSALDPLLTSHVAHTIQNLANQGYIILIATHDTVLIDKLNCDIYLMENGKIIETASSQSFTNNKKKYPHIEAFVSGVIE